MKSWEKYKELVKNWIDTHGDEFEEISKYIWSHPELGLEEYEASEKLCNVLEKYGFSIEKGVAGMPTAFIAIYGQGSPVIGYNAEYDCLPALSQKSGKTEKDPIIPGAPGQGCGHNLLGVAEVMGAIALKEVMAENKIQGTIKVFGSPAEEVSIGKPFMGRAGCYEGVDCFLDWHPWSYNKADYDTFGAYFSIKYHFKGRTAHGNAPWHGRSALDAAQLTTHAIEMLREHVVPAAADKAHTINYTFADVGPAIPNVVSDTCVLWCVGRLTTFEEAAEVVKRIDKCAEAGALATETVVEKQIITQTHEKIPNKVLSKIVYDDMVDLGAPAFTEEEQEIARQMQISDGVQPKGLDTTIKEFGTSGSALCDTSEFSWNAPYACFWMTMVPEGGWHNWKVTACAGSSIGMKTLRQAGKLLAINGVSVLEKPEMLVEAKKELELRLGGRKYECLIPREVQPSLGLNKEVMEQYRKFYD